MSKISPEDQDFLNWINTPAIPERYWTPQDRLVSLIRQLSPEEAAITHQALAREAQRVCSDTLTGLLEAFQVARGQEAGI